jgi:hypothetical protein
MYISEKHKADMKHLQSADIAAVTSTDYTITQTSKLTV